MKIEITQAGMGSKVFNDDGTEVQGVTGIRVTAGLDGPTVAEIELLFADTTVTGAKPSFIVGGYSNVEKLVLADRHAPVRMVGFRAGQSSLGLRKDHGFIRRD